MAIETEYRGYKLSYAENRDVWECWACNMNAPTLSKLKAKIDKLHLDLRKKSAFDCLLISLGDVRDVRALDARIVTKRRQEGFSSVTYKAVQLRVQKSGRGGGKSTTWSDIEDIAPFGPETDAAIERLKRAQEAVRVARDEESAARKAIPRMTDDDPAVRALMEAARTRFEEGADADAS